MITKTYKEQSWKDDIKKLLKQAGSKQIPTVFLVSDSQIIKESYLEDVCSILNSGEVQGIMTQEDHEEIFTDLKYLLKEKNLGENRDSVSAFFNQNVRENLHIVLAFSPVGSKFRNRCRMVRFLI